MAVISISGELWLAIMLFLAQQMDSLFRNLEGMTLEQREEWRKAQLSQYQDHMAWLAQIMAAMAKEGGFGFEGGPTDVSVS
ncbi:MAG: hypothetical protein ACXABY_28365 [Candidatus Thorarchaeota archaeon]|jgi:hypothetical protein